jgi:hypothetical protein
MLQQVVHGLARLRDRVEQVRVRGHKVVDGDLVRVWREYMPEAIAPALGAERPISRNQCCC